MPIAGSGVQKKKTTVNEGDIFVSLTKGHTLTVEYVFEQKLPYNRGYVAKTICRCNTPDRRPTRRQHIKVSSLLNTRVYRFNPIGTGLVKAGPSR